MDNYEHYSIRNQEIFQAKLNAMSTELDIVIAARIAKLILEQYEIRRKKVDQLTTTKSDGGTNFLTSLVSDLNYNGDKIFVDDIPDRRGLKGKPINERMQGLTHHVI